VGLLTASSVGSFSATASNPGSVPGTSSGVDVGARDAGLEDVHGGQYNEPNSSPLMPTKPTPPEAGNFLDFPPTPKDASSSSQKSFVETIDSGDVSFGFGNGYNNSHLVIEQEDDESDLSDDDVVVDRDGEGEMEADDRASTQLLADRASGQFSIDALSFGNGVDAVPDNIVDDREEVDEAKGSPGIDTQDSGVSFTAAKEGPPIVIVET